MLESSSQRLAGGDPNVGEQNSKLRQLSISSILNKPKSHRSAEAEENDSSMSEKAVDDQSQISEQEAQSENKQQKAKKQKEIEEELKEDLEENKS